MLSIHLKRQKLVYTCLHKCLRAFSNRGTFDQIESEVLASPHSRHDLPSLRESLQDHFNAYKNKEELKHYVTSDPLSLEILNQMVEHKAKNGASKEELQFFKETIMFQPCNQNELASIKVAISDIRDYPIFESEYKKKAAEKVMICVGGPASEDQALMASIIPAIRSQFSKIVYMTRTYAEANGNHSASQSHARHGTALNAEEELTGHRLIFKVLQRLIFGDKIENVLYPDYRKVDIKFDLWKISKWMIYVKNETYWLVEEIKRRRGLLNDHDKNRIGSVLSQNIMHSIEKKLNIEMSGNAREFKDPQTAALKPDEKTDSSSIMAVFSEENRQEVLHENENLERVNLKVIELDRDEMKRVFFRGHANMLTAFRYIEDSYIHFDLHVKNRKQAEMHGVDWRENCEVAKILVARDEKSGDAQIAGVITRKGEYVYGTHLHMSGGYKVSYDYDPDSKARFTSSNKIRNSLNRLYDRLGLFRPLCNDITTATGVSANAIFVKNEPMKALIEQYGGTNGCISVTNSHWTMVAESPTHALVRMTGGGNTGSELYKPAYFINLVANTKKIFGEDFVGITSVYGCCRAINFKNSTQFTEFAKNGIITYGKGGTGMTKRHKEAAMVLCNLGFANEIRDYFDQASSGLGSRILDSMKWDNEAFYENTKERTKKRMGFA